MLLSNMRQQHHIRALALAYWTRPKGPQASWANIHNLTQTFGWNFPTVLFPSRALLRNTLPGSEQTYTSWFLAREEHCCFF